MANLTLGELIAFLETLPFDKELSPGFASAHCDRGDYSNLAFSPVEKSTAGEMLRYARKALNTTMTGYKGGEYQMSQYTDVLIGKWGECGENINSAHLRLWSQP